MKKSTSEDGVLSDSWFRRIQDLVSTQWATPGVGRATACSPLVGAAAGLGAVAFSVLLEHTVSLVLGGLLGFHTPPTGRDHSHPVTYPGPWWLLILIPAAGGLISGLLVFSYAPEAEGHGTDSLVRTFHRGFGVIRGRVPFIKAIASILTIGFGGSAGEEGPIAQIGAGLGSALARLLRLTAEETRLLMLAGAAGGMGAIFRAPLGGALFAVEVVYSSTAMESAALLPCMVSAIVAYSTFALFLTPRALFVAPNLNFHGFTDLPLFVLLGLACVALGGFYVKAFYGLQDRLFQRMPIKPDFKPMVGGAMFGLLAVGYPQLMASGYGWIQWGAIGEILPQTGSGPRIGDPQMALGLLLTLAFLKPLATGLTVGSGGSGGLFGPSLFIGGMLGGAAGQLIASFFPSSDIQPAAYALVGMGGFFAGVSKTPLTSIVMVSEIAGSYALLVPMMLVCALTMALSQRWTLYREQVDSPMDSPVHQGDFLIDVLEGLRVRDVPIRTSGLELIPSNLPFPSLIRRVADSHETVFPVVDSDRRFAGIIAIRDLRPAFLEENFGPLVLAADIAHEASYYVTPADDLHQAQKLMTELDIDELPVVDPNDPGLFIGLLDRRELILAQTTRVEELRKIRSARVKAGKHGPREAPNH